MMRSPPTRASWFPAAGLPLRRLGHHFCEVAIPTADGSRTQNGLLWRCSLLSNHECTRHERYRYLYFVAPALRARSAAAQPADDPPPLKRDYAGPQEIVSYFPHAVNRVQTIRRPDLVVPPNLKFPMRLQSMVMLPSQAVPVLAPRPPEEVRPAPPKPIVRNIEIPIPEPTVELPKLVSVPAAPAEEAPTKPATAPQPSAADSSVAVEKLTPRKSVIVVNAVNVAPDPAVQVPDAQLAGNFVVGPSLGTSVPANSSASGTGRSAENGPAKSSASVYKGSGAGANNWWRSRRDHPRPRARRWKRKSRKHSCRICIRTGDRLWERSARSRKWKRQHKRPGHEQRWHWRNLHFRRHFGP
jgi:hypothetical protein